jgi:hypothetical protein
LTEKLVLRHCFEECGYLFGEGTCLWRVPVCAGLFVEVVSWDLSGARLTCGWSGSSNKDHISNEEVQRSGSGVCVNDFGFLFYCLSFSSFVLRDLSIHLFLFSFFRDQSPNAEEHRKR